MGHRNVFIGVFIAGLCLECSAPHLAMADAVKTADRVVESPNAKIVFHLLDRDAAFLRYQIKFGSIDVIETSRIGILLDGENLSEGATVESVERYKCDEQYPSRIGPSTAVNRCNGAKFQLLHKKSNTRFVLEVRAFDNGVAFRYFVPGTGLRTPDAAAEFTIPATSTVWHHDLRGHYEGVHESEAVESIDSGKWLAPPLTFQLPQDAGYASITEAALVNYAGMALQAGGDRVLQERLGHSQPVGRPFALRFSKEEAERLSHAAAIDGDILTPWRVVTIGTDLNTLVNCGMVQDLASPPDKELFPNGLATDWIKPGRCVWKFLDGGKNDLPTMMEFSRHASDLGFEYNLIEGFWQRWSENDLRSLVDYSRKKNVGIWLWKDSRSLHTRANRDKFFGLCQSVGVVGVKIDFLDHEAKEVIDFYRTLLEEAAHHRLMVNFHGANKPAGEVRTWPNELTREGIKGLEGKLDFRARHDATLPFTRFLAGPADYTPVVFGPRRGDTTAAHQIATAAVFTSPLLVYGGHPKSLLDHPAVDMIKNIPSIWDETIVLPGSSIGKTAAFARRRGDDWFVAVVGGPQAQKLTVSLSFLNATPYSAMLMRDQSNDPTIVKIEKKLVTSSDSLRIELADGGGFIGQFSPRPPRLSSSDAAYE